MALARNENEQIRGMRPSHQTLVTVNSRFFSDTCIARGIGLLWPSHFYRSGICLHQRSLRPRNRNWIAQRDCPRKSTPKINPKSWTARWRWEKWFIMYFPTLKTIPTFFFFWTSTSKERLWFIGSLMTGKNRSFPTRLLEAAPLASPFGYWLKRSKAFLWKKLQNRSRKMDGTSRWESCSSDRIKGELMICQSRFVNGRQLRPY